MCHFIIKLNSTSNDFYENISCVILLKESVVFNKNEYITNLFYYSEIGLSINLLFMFTDEIYYP